MLRYVAKRLLWLIPVVLGVSIFIFTILYFTPGDPVKIMLGNMATAEQIAEKREELGLDKPFIVQYADYMKNLILHGDLGRSYITKERIMNSIILRFPYTFKIALISMLLSIILGVPMGISAAINQHTWKDNASMFFSMVFVSLPGFWIALEMVILFSVKLHWLPAMGVNDWKCYIMPCVSVCLGGIATNARQTRSSMLEVIRQDYITTARSKGLGERTVILKHALKNALIPIITTIGGSFAGLMGGSLIAETVFAIPGMGVYIMTAISTRDYPVIRGSCLVISVWFSICILLIDIIYAFVDPRIRQQYVSK